MNTRQLLVPLILLQFACLSAVMVLPAAAASRAASEPAAQKLELDRKGQKFLQLTVYDDFAVVQEVREVAMPTGLVELEYLDVAKSIDPTSVMARSLGAGDRWLLLEQSYRYDLLNRESLLETYIGRKLKYSRSVLQGSTYEKVLREGILLSTNPEIVKFGDEIEIAPEGVISLAGLPQSLSLRPSLVWLVENQVEGPQKIETSYIADSIGWQADYVFLLDESRERFDLSSWITINNRTGTAFNRARLKLIAGNVQRERTAAMMADGGQEMLMQSMSMRAKATAPVAVNAAFEYHEYSLPLESSLRNNERKQFRFMQADGVPYTKVYSLVSQTYPHQNPQQEERQVEVQVVFENAKRKNLGLPMPAGTVRAYRRSDDGRQLVGQAQMAHSPVGDEIRLTIGRAFDVRVERRQTQFKRLGERNFEASYEVVVRNAKDTSVSVRLDEKLHGDWVIDQASQTGVKQDSTTQRYLVSVPARGESKLTYRVRWSYQ